MTNGEILEIFEEKYLNLASTQTSFQSESTVITTELRVKDYRPLCPELFTHDLKGITIWLKNGDVIQYYPKEAQGDKG